MGLPAPLREDNEQAGGEEDDLADCQSPGPGEDDRLECGDDRSGRGAAEKQVRQRQEQPVGGYRRLIGANERRGDPLEDSVEPWILPVLVGREVLPGFILRATPFPGRNLMPLSRSRLPRSLAIRR